MSIEQYIQCFENCTLRHLESLAMLGLIVDINEENCVQRRFKKLVVRLFNGKMVSSSCHFEEEIEHATKIIKTYMEIAKKNNAIGKLQILESLRDN